MKAAVLKSPGVLELEELPMPQCPPGGALLKIEACAVCGTDVKMLDLGHRDLAYPRILGHEIVGRIEEIDRKIDSEYGIKEGDLCQVWPGIACQSCPACFQEADKRCRKLKIMGFNCDGGFAEYMPLQKECFPRGINVLPKGFDPAVAALAEPIGCCINGQEQTRILKGDVVLICGGGPIGALHALLAESRGAGKIIVTETLPGRVRELEKHTSARVIDLSTYQFSDQEGVLDKEIERETGGDGVDVILTATPEVKLDQSQMKLLAPGGRICIFSGPKPGHYEKTIDLRSMHYNEQMIVGAYGCSSRQNSKAVELLTTGSIKADWVITRRADLSEILDAFRYSSSRSGLKSVICRF